MLTTRPIEILLVEDNPGDAELILDELSEKKLRNRVHLAEDGQEALDFFNKTGKFKERPTPDIVLLDLNLPKVSGHEVLSFIKNSEEFRRIPVIVLTSSEADADILKSYDLQANSYIQKPVDLDKFLTIVRAIENFWFKIVKLSSEGRDRGNA